MAQTHDQDPPPEVFPLDPLEGVASLSFGGVQFNALDHFTFSDSRGSGTPESPATPPARGIHGGTSDQEIHADLSKTPFFCSSFAVESLQMIGSGGGGTVFRAFDPGLDRWQVIKVLRQKPTAEAAGSFLVEARTLSKLENHPNLVKVYHYQVSAGGRPFFVMEEVPQARTLGEVINDYFTAAVGDPTKVEWRNRNHQLIRFFLEALAALEHLHEQGFIHRDLKPGNILVSNVASSTGANIKRHAYVTDFGISSVSSGGEGVDIPETSGGEVVFRGTPRYAAPEQIPGNGQVTQRTDIYQLALVLRHLMLNRAPLEDSGKSAGEILVALRTAKDPVSLYGDPLIENPALPPELVAIMHKGLSIKPEDRYPTARQFREDIEAFLDGRRVEAYDSELSMGQSVCYGIEKAGAASYRWVRANLGISLTLAALAVGGAGLASRAISKQRSDAAAELAALKVEEATKRLEGEIRQARERAVEVLNAARKMANAGKLDAAVALVQPEIVDSLGRYADRDASLRETHETLVREHLERKMLLDMKSFELEGYAAAVSGPSPAVLGNFDRAALLKARACFLPEGLSGEGIETFERMMRSSHYSQQQRKEIADTLTKLSLFLLVLDHQPLLPWSSSIPEDVRKQLVRECSLIERVCAACEVRAEPLGINEVASCIRQTEYYIRRSIDSSTPPPTFDTGVFPVNSTMAAWYRFLESFQGAPQPVVHVETTTRTIAMAEEACSEANKNGFIEWILLASILEQVPTNSSVESYKHSFSATKALIAAYNNSASASGAGNTIEHRDLLIQASIMATRIAKEALSLPLQLRPSPRSIATAMSPILRTNEELRRVPEARLALAYMELVLGIGSDSIDQTAVALAKDPRFKSDALLLDVWNQLNRNKPVDADKAEALFGEQLELRAPILAARIRLAQNRPEDALKILAAAKQRDPKWADDIRYYGSKGGYLSPLLTTHPAAMQPLLSDTNLTSISGP